MDRRMTSINPNAHALKFKLGGSLGINAPKQLTWPARAARHRSTDSMRLGEEKSNTG